MPQGSRHFFPSSSRPFGPSRPNQTFLHSFNQSLPPPPPSPLLIASDPSHSFPVSPSLSLLPRHRCSFPLLLDAPRLSAGSLQPSAECAFPLLSLVVSILPAVRLSRSCGSFVSLVISSYGHCCVSLRLGSRVPLARGSISSARILWKVSVLFVLALWAVSLFLSLSFWSLSRSGPFLLVSCP